MAIESVTRQTHRNWELLIVDDSGLDENKNLIEEYLKNPKIIYLRNLSKGVSSARNTALRAASGDLVAYIDDDNVWVPEFLEVSISAIEATGADLTHTAVRLNTDPEFRTLPSENSQRVIFGDISDIQLLKWGNFVDLNTLVHKTSVTRGAVKFDENLRRLVDWDFLLNLLSQPGIKAQSIPFIGVDYDSTPRPSRISISEELIVPMSVIRNRYLINWNNSLIDRVKDKISIIMCAFNNWQDTEKALESIVRNTFGVDFEVIVVDNGSSPIDHFLMRSKFATNPAITWVRSPENLNFSLGNNLGFSYSNGEYVVFLNNDTLVTPDWIDGLIRPLKSGLSLGTQPTLLFPDGTIQSLGVAFLGTQNPLGHALFSGLAGSSRQSQQSFRVRALSGACLAVKAETFANVNGFDCHYVNGQEDIDLCLRIGKGEKVFQHVSDSVVIHLESRTKGRHRYTRENRLLFVSRWNEAILDDRDLFLEFEETFALETEIALEMDDRLKISKMSAVSPSRRIKTTSQVFKSVNLQIACPNRKDAKFWGDYFYASSLAKSFEKQGMRTSIQFSQDPNPKNVDINICLAGLHVFDPVPGAKNLYWLISHPELLKVENLKGFDALLVASNAPYKFEAISKEAGISLHECLQATDPSRFFEDLNSKKEDAIYFVGNTRGVERKFIIDLSSNYGGPTLKVVGRGWDGLIPQETILSDSLRNAELGDTYRRAAAVANESWSEMTLNQMANNRVFDVLACGTPIVTDSVSGIPDEMLPGIVLVGSNDEISGLNHKLENLAQSGELSKIAQSVRAKHSFDKRAFEIIGILESS